MGTKTSLLIFYFAACTYGYSTLQEQMSSLKKLTIFVNSYTKPNIPNHYTPSSYASEACTVSLHSCRKHAEN